MAVAVTFDEARRVADAVLFEGYLLYPYRASATKNQMRWQFGIVAPPGAGTGDADVQQAEVLADGLTDDSRVDVCVRFLHLETRHDTTDWDEGRVVEHTCSSTVAELRGPGGIATSVTEPAGARDVDGVAFERAALAAEIRVSAERIPGPYGAVRLRVRITNTGTTPPADAPRASVMRTSLVGTHSLLAVDHGRFVSPVDPPEWARPAVDACRHVGCFPVLVGERDDVLLCSPIILADHPEIAPESPLPLFDATEIDEILVLRTLALGDDEKAEARRTDPRARELIDRVDDMAPEIFERLHGAIRSLRTVDDRGDPTVEIGGAIVGPGSHVRLRPGPNADAQDLFWTGRSAVVTEVRHDVDGHTHVAVLADDDPGADVRAWQGRYLYFDPAELEVLDGGAP
ncbi:MAG TPA: hypothetical protein VGN51_15685 [Acidimicrobiia bacterium]|jgi:hypothetical protein